MTVSSALDRKTFTGDDATTAFATTPVVFFDETDLQVYVIVIATGVATLQSLTTDYTVSGGAGSTGTVTMLTAPASTEQLLIKRVVPITQAVDLVNNDASDAETMEDSLDKLTMIAQQLSAGSVSGGYPLRISDAETPTDALTVLPFDRASKLLGFNSAKELVVYDPADGANDSASVTFLPYGTGAVASDLQTRGREIVPVWDYLTDAQRADATLDVYAKVQQLFDNISSGTTGVGLSGSGPAPLIILPARDLVISQKITFPNAAYIKGQGRWSSRFVADAGFTGIMLQDKGNASKIILEDFQVYANDETGVTNLIDLGNGGGVWGTGGRASGLLLRGGASAVNVGTVGLYHQSNVISVLDVHTMYCGTGIEEVAGTNVCYYDDISVLGADTYGLKTNGESAIGRIEIEAPAAACVGIYVNREASIQHLTYSQASGVTNPYAIEIDASATSFSMATCVHAATGGSTLTNLIKDNRASGGFQTNWGARSASQRRTTLVGDELHIGSTNAFRIAGMQLTNFVLRIINTAGTLQHSIGSGGDQATAGPYQAAINGSSASLANTPTGADGSTAFTSGAKVSSAATNVLVLDTLDHATQQNALLLSANITRLSTGDNLTVLPRITSRNINGTTRERLEFALYSAADGAAFAINTTNIGASEFIDIQFAGFLLVTSG